MRASRKIDCDEATRLISAGLDRELSPPARATLRLHYTMCTACRRFESQMQAVRRALRGMQVGDVQEPGGKDDAAP
jgi:predicted anti-sigma-YlaC factor YlaD